MTVEERIRKENLLQRLTEFLTNPISFHTLGNKNVENAILDFAKNSRADFIVMVSKDYNFLQKQFLDTTVEEVSSIRPYRFCPFRDKHNTPLNKALRNDICHSFPVFNEIFLRHQHET
ncbi:hypothetical protein SAMN05421636_10579 [Pricia antarctica]|uniref:Uncharacterized protein n=1 Tax=Pricia antarctica TaxID=641691 RepID=A0A1G7CZP8_9FLAO|nr:hypothetical protein [Pricia antarctica]SDE44156.1 hypothetical protein SAMN05421636_10579 [Pricia antarctica]